MKTFGKRDQFSLELAPVEPSWRRESVSDRGPWAGLSIFMRNLCLTSAIDDDTKMLGDLVYVPLIPLANWLFDNIRYIAYEESNAHFHPDVNLHDALAKWNEAEYFRGYSSDIWEDLRYEWYRRHFWITGLEGCLLPDLAFVKADERLWLSWSKPHFAGPRKLIFIEGPGSDFVEWSLAWPVLNDFVAYVAEDARRRGLSMPAWVSEEKPLETAVRCSAADFISLVAPDARDLLERLKINPDENPDHSEVLQALRDLQILQETKDDTYNALSTLARIATAASQDLPKSRDALISRGISPEEAGYDAAIWLRKELSLDGGPFDTAGLETALRRISLIENVPGRSLQNHSVIGMRSGNMATTVLIDHARMKKPWAKRMELARALGHLLLDPLTSDGILGAGSSQVARGPRRRRSGAFAAELLLPKSGIESFLGGRDPAEPSTFEEIMEKFQVAAHTAAYHLGNRKFLNNVEDRDALIAEYGSNYGPDS